MRLYLLKQITFTEMCINAPQSPPALVEVKENNLTPLRNQRNCHKCLKKLQPKTKKI